MWTIATSEHAQVARDGHRRIVACGNEILLANFAKGAPRGDMHLPWPAGKPLDTILCEVLWVKARMNEPWKRHERKRL